MTFFPLCPPMRALDRNSWQLADDYINRYTGRVIRRGFTFDGASIPRVLWRIAGHPMTGDILPAALEHDAEYSAQLISRDDADERFLFNMRRLGIGYLRRYTFYWAVRLFGWRAWDDNAEYAIMERKFVTRRTDEKAKGKAVEKEAENLYEDVREKTGITQQTQAKEGKK